LKNKSKFRSKFKGTLSREKFEIRDTLDLKKILSRDFRPAVFFTTSPAYVLDYDIINAEIFASRVAKMGGFSDFVYRISRRIRSHLRNDINLLIMDLGGVD
jgi:hypothetical protein